MTTVADPKAGRGAKALTRRGAALGREGRWNEAAQVFRELALAQDGVNRPVGRSPKFPGRGQTLDGWVRAALAHEQAGEDEASSSAWRMADALDAGLKPWRERSDRRDPALWALIDGPLDSEADALALISGAAALSMPDSWWFCAYIQLYRRAWVCAACQAKDKAAEVVRLTQAGSLSYQAIAHADEGAWDAALAILPREAANAHLGAGLSLLAGRRDQAAAWWDMLDPAPEDAAFAQVVRGVSIAIVGAASPERAQGAEIDGFDLVVRTNFRDAAIIRPHAAAIGARTDIAYFNGNFEPDHREMILKGLESDGPRHIVLRFDDPEALAAYRGRAVVRISGIVNPFYRMNAYAIPKIVHDLLRFRPGRIKVFNADFFLGAQPHYAGYLDYDINLVQSFRGHDVLRNARLMRLWRERNLIEADERLEGVLSLSEPELIDRITERLRAR